MSIHRILGTVMVLFCILTQIKAEKLPDSLITDDNVYRFMFSDTRKAEAIMAALRENGKMPEWELDYTEGDLYYNTGRNYKALKYYAEALGSRKARKDNTLRMDLLHRMISCYDMVHNETRKAEYVKRLMKEAQTCGDKAMQAVALFNMGKSEYNQGDHKGGCRRMEQAARMMASTRYEYKYDNLRYHYNTLLTYYEHDHRGKDALRVLNELEKVAVASTGKEKVSVEGLGEKERKAFYGHRAVVMNMLGRNEEADECYRKFQSLGKPTDRDQYIIMPYLFARKMYGEVLRINLMREKMLKQEGDTINYHFTTIRKDLAQAYFEMGDYKRAAINFERLAVLRDSIKNREQQSAALELAEAYDSAEKDKIIMEQDVHKIILGSIVAAAVIALAIFFHYNRKLRRRNVFLVRAVKDGLKAKDDLLNKEAECKALKEKLEEMEMRMEEMGRQDKADENNGASVSATGSGMSTRDIRLMEQVICEIEDRRLYLQPKLAQKDVLDIVHMPSYQFGTLFKRHTGESFNEYINRRRMEYAAKQLIEHTDYTVEAIAEECGFSTKQYFHRKFLEFSGLTPSDFRKANKSTDSQ